MTVRLITLSSITLIFSFSRIHIQPNTLHDTFAFCDTGLTSVTICVRLCDRRRNRNVSDRRECIVHRVSFRVGLPDPF